MRLPPYQERQNETLLQKCERLRRELLGARSPVYANDNQPVREAGARPWYCRGDME